MKLRHVAGSSFVRGVSWTMGANVLVALLGFGSSVLAARLLGPEGRGDLSVLFLVISLVAQFGLLGVNQAVAWKVGAEPEKEPDIANSGLWLACIGGIAYAVLLALGGAFILPQDKVHLVGALYVLAWSLPIIWIGEILLAVDQGAARFRRRAYIRTLPPIAFLVGAIVWSTGFGASVIGFIYAYVVGHAIAGIVRLFAFNFRTLFRLPKREDLRAMVQKGMRLHSPHVAFLLFSKLDLVLVAYLMPSSEVGVYAVALAVPVALGSLLEALAQVSFSEVASKKNRKDQLESLLAHFRFNQKVSLLLIVPLFVFLPFVILYVFGQDFANALPLAYVLSVNWILLSWTNGVDRALRAMGSSAPGTLVYLASLVILGIGGALLLPDVGLLWFSVLLCASTATGLFIIVCYLVGVEKVPAIAVFRNPRGFHEQERG